MARVQVNNALCSTILVVSVAVGGCATGSESTDESTNSHIDRLALRAPYDAWQVRQAECLTEMGFPASVAPENAIGSVVPMQIDYGNDYDAFLEAEQSCEEKIGAAPEMPLLSDAELGKLYDLEVQAYECLVEHGYQPDPPSTREEYVATYYTGTSWTAFFPSTPGSGMLPDTECQQPMAEDITW